MYEVYFLFFYKRETSRNIWNNNNTNNNNISPKFKEQITGQTGNNGTKVVEIMVPLKYLSNFELPLILEQDGNTQMFFIIEEAKRLF